MEYIYVLAVAGIPFYLIYDALKDAKSRRKTREEIISDPLGLVFTLGVFVGWVGWFLWLISDGHLSSGYFGLMAVAFLICALIWERVRRGRKKR